MVSPLNEKRPVLRLDIGGQSLVTDMDSIAYPDEPLYKVFPYGDSWGVYTGSPEEMSFSLWLFKERSEVELFAMKHMMGVEDDLSD